MELKKPSSLPHDAEDEEEIYKEMLSVASANECTGMIPSAPTSRAELESYSEIYHIPVAGGCKKKVLLRRDPDKN